GLDAPLALVLTLQGSIALGKRDCFASALFMPCRILYFRGMQKPLADVVVRPTRIGSGLVAMRPYRPNQTIIRIVGRIVDHTVLWKRGGKFADNCYRFGPETYLDPGDDQGRYVNHSCVPNAGIRKVNNQLFLFAAKPIRAGREIVIDYSTI